MSIVDALEKAKRLARERNVSADRGRTVPRRPVVSAAPAVPVAAGHATAQGPVGLRVELPVVPYDVASCGANRIVVPGIDQKLQQAAASPYRMLRTRVLQRCRSNNWSVIGLTSPGPGEGKSVTTLNLAIHIAREANNDVFLIDLDMRNPSVCRYLGIVPPVDLSDFFRGSVGASEVLFSPDIEHLTVAGSYQPIENASERLANDRLDQLLEHIRAISQAPLIMLDLPPVASTDEALVVAPRVDAVVLVLSEGVTRRDSLDSALELLSAFTLAGVVLNKSLDSLGSDYYGAHK